jgi:hypothetical protein
MPKLGLKVVDYGLGFGQRAFSLFSGLPLGPEISLSDLDTINRT